MTTPTHRTGTVRSGDVDVFYRHFGAQGATPILITHGANYYDSEDWIEVATALAADREVAAYDTRGFGRSSWSPSKDYTQDAQMGDMEAVLDHLGWKQAILLGHSQGGGRVILFGARFPDRVAAVIIVDHCPGRGGSDPTAAVQSIGNPPILYASVEAAVESMSRDGNVPDGSAARARLESILTPVEGGFTVPKDPDCSNPVPVGIDGWKPNIVVTDMWAELASIACPIIIFRATFSNRYGAEALARVRDELSHIALVDIESGHDVVGGAQSDLIDGARRFLAERMAEAAAS